MIDLKAKINNKIHDIAVGAVFSDELTEKLASAVIKIPHIDNFQLRPYEDVYIYTGDFVGFPNVQYKKNYDFEIELSRTIVKNGPFNYTDPRSYTMGVFWHIEEIGAWRDFYQNYTAINESESTRIYSNFNIEVYLRFGNNPSFKTIFHSQGTHSQSDDIVFVNEDYGEIYGYFQGSSDASEIVISTLSSAQTGIGGFSIVSVQMDAPDLNQYFLQVEQSYYYFFVDRAITNDLEKQRLNEKVIIDIGGIEIQGKITDMITDSFKIRFSYGGIERTIDMYYEGDENILYGELVLINVTPTINSINYSYFLKSETYPLPNFYKHFLVDNYIKEELELGTNKINLTLNLFSETKYLEKIQLPNVTLTQPLNHEKRKSVWFYLQKYVQLYGPTRNYVIDENSKTYEKAPRFYLDESLKDIYDNVFAPDFQLNNPNLKDVLTQLMIVKDRIPYVENNVIKAKNLSERKGVFNDENVNYVTETMSSENYASNLKRTYSNALSEKNTARFIEKTGFRNKNESLLTIDNLTLETRFPIYKIDRVLMCYYKKVFIQYGAESERVEKMILCKQDITKLVKTNSQRELLSKNWRELETGATAPTTIDELAEYKFATVGYDIGSKEISGWGEKYTFNFFAWFDTTKTYIENIATYLDKFTPLGVNTYGYVKEAFPQNVIVSAPDNFFTSVVNPFSNQTLAVKGLFFEIQYQGFYNGTLVHSKNNAFDEITANDNPSSSLTLLESDGLHEKEKINRLGNEIYYISARYDNLSQIQDVGTVYRDDIIPYQSEYSIYSDYIMCQYIATKHYVLKNYFTSVFSKHRPTSLASYDESIIRAENKKMYVLLSKDTVYYEKEKNIPMSDLSYNSLILSAVFPSPEVLSLNNFQTPDRINAGFFSFNGKNYLSDANVFVSGVSLALNLSMYDNVSSGVYIKTPELTAEQKAIGSEQSWYILTDDIETGELSNLGIYVAHIDQSVYFDEKVQDFDRAKVIDVYNNVLFKMPYVDNVEMFTSNVIGSSYDIQKDNKEILDFTFQIEPIALNDDIVFSEWLMKLSDLLGNYNKVKQTYRVRDTNSPAVAANTFASTYVNVISIGTLPVNISYAIIQIDIPTNAFDSILDTSIFTTKRFEYFKYKSKEISWYIDLIHLVEKTPNYLVIRCFFRDEKRKIQRVENITFYRFGYKGTPSSVFEQYPFRNQTDASSNYMSFGISYNREDNGFLELNYPYSNGYLVYGAPDGNLQRMTTSNSIQSYLNILDAQEYIEGVYEKNMYFYKSSEKVKQEMVYNAYLKNEMPTNLTEIDGEFYLNDNQTIPHINFKSDDIDSETQSIHYYFLDGDRLKLVLAFNLNDAERLEKHITIYHSLVNEQDNRVYDDFNNLIGKRANMLNDRENYGKNNYYVII